MNLAAMGNCTDSAPNSTDFPQPLGPMMASELPSSTAKDRPLKTVAVPKAIARSSTSSAFAIHPKIVESSLC